ncbi:hypothetical protein R5R35_012219 [Gryllus longicercus]|uniref:SKICH domain-containing protein n=1 Tax=Gryllus longicercus TaxID=2509291 RepID=A0AAN9VJ11_9ORTH
MADEESNGFLLGDVTTSLLQEYSIAENLDVDGDHSSASERPTLRDAFSRYAKVIFHDIADSYPTDADVQCFFSLTLDMKRKEGDFVGLFRLGWRSPSDIITSQLVPKPTSEDQCDFQVCFRASDLPKEEGEIYQLCYISENEVWGASVPFEFRRATAEELLVVDSGDIVIVRSQSAVAEDLKSQLALVRQQLLATEACNVEIKKNMEQLLLENERLHERLEDLDRVEKLLSRLRADNLELDKARNISEEAVRNADLHIGSLNSVISALHKDMTILQEQVSSQAEEIAKYRGMAENASAQRGCTQDLIDALREGKELAVREMRVALAENDKMRSELKVATDEKEELTNQLEVVTKKYEAALENQEKNEKAYMKRIEDLLVQLTKLSSDSQQRLFEAKTETELFQKRVNVLQDELQQKKQHLEVLAASTAVSDCSTSNDNLISNSFVQIPVPAQNPGVEFQSSAQQMVEAQDALFKDLKKRLEDVQNRTKEVCNEIEELRAEMEVLQQTEQGLIESKERLANRIHQLQSQITDAEGCGNSVEASLHHRELETAEMKMQEKDICLESACQRREELEKQLSELQEFKDVLDQQKTETIEALSKLGSEEMLVVANEAFSGETATQASDGLPELAMKTPGELEVLDLRERLRQAAEAYKLLYQQKLRAEQELAREQMQWLRLERSEQ